MRFRFLKILAPLTFLFVMTVNSQTVKPISKDTPHILIIGAELGEFLFEALPSEGYRTSFVEAYTDSTPNDKVFEDLRTGNYDLVIVAYWASLELLFEIRDRFPQIKTIFLNSHKYEWDQEAKRKGVNAVLRVPHDHDELLKTIKRLLTH